MTPLHRRSRLWLVLIAAVALAACHHAPAAAPSAALKAQPLAQLARGCQPGPLASDVLACVEGVAITAPRFAAVRPSYAAQVSNPQVLQALIDEELLVAAAERKGTLAATRAQAQGAALAAALLETEVEHKLGPAQVADEDIHRAYLQDAVREHYRHAPGYTTTDVQLLCCSGGQRNCSESPDAQRCIDKLAPEAQALYAELMANPPRSSLEMNARALALKVKRPLITVGAVSFYYDISKPYDNQGGHYTLVVREFVDHVTPLKPGQISAPFRSPFGWHITRLDDFSPASNRPWTDPAVKKEVAEMILDLVRGREAEKKMAELMQRAKVELFADRLDVSLTQ